MPVDQTSPAEFSSRQSNDEPNTANAIKAYEGYFQYNLEFVDPYIEYSDLLKATDGIVQARQKIDAAYNAHPDSPVLDLTDTRLLDDPAARLTIGKRLSDRIYLTYSRSLSSSTQDQIILLEYDQTDRFSWILSRNEDRTYALDVRVRHAF